MNKEISKVKLKKLRKSLPSGAIEKLAKKSRCSKNLVEKVFRSERVRLDVIQNAIEMAESFKKKKLKLKKQIQKL